MTFLSHHSGFDNRVPVVTRDGRSDSRHVGALMLRNRRGGVERDRVPNCLCTALPHNHA